MNDHEKKKSHGAVGKIIVKGKALVSEKIRFKIGRNQSFSNNMHS